MRTMALYTVELHRLFCKKTTWLVFFLSVFSPLLGLIWYRPIGSSSASGYSTTLGGTYIGNPALAGALCTALFFCFLTAYEYGELYKNRTERLLFTIVSPGRVSVCRTLSLVTLAVAMELAVLLVWVPIAAVKMGEVFRLRLAVEAYLLIMLPAAVYAILICAAAFHLTRRMDLSMILTAVLMLLSLTVWQSHWLLCMINPAVSFISDDFGYHRLMMSVAYNRLFWGVLLLGVWLLSFTWIRKYERGLLRSVCYNLRYVPLWGMGLILLGTSVLVYIRQPFLDHSLSEICYQEVYNEEVENTTVRIEARPNLDTGCMYGTAVYQFQNYSGAAQTVSFTINPGYRVLNASVDGEKTAWRDLGDDNMNSKTIEVDLPAGQGQESEQELVLEYGGFPQEWNILELCQGEPEISKESIYLTNGNFAPVPKDFYSAYGEDVVQIDLDLPKGMTPVLFGTGTVEKKEETESGEVHWLLRDNSPSVILYAGDYVSKHLEASGVQVDFYYSRKHEKAMEQSRVDEVIQNVFRYCSEHYGPLTFYEGGTLKLIEAGFGGGYAAGGASTMGEDSFSAQGLSDPRKGAGASEVLAHEIVHQWWGLGQMFDSENSTDVWSSEGLTVYTTYRLMEELYGEDYVQKHYTDLWKREVADYYDNYYVRHPEYFDMLPEADQAKLLNHFSQMRRYCEMPLMLLKAQELLGGEEKMDEVLAKLFTSDEHPEYPYLTMQDFLDISGLTEEELSLE